MNEEELSDVMKKISSMLNSSNIESSGNSNNSEDSNDYSTYNSSDSSDTQNNGFNIDFETLLKIKSIMDKMNSKKDSPRSNLLLSLKPYLNDRRKDKMDQYIKLLNMGEMIELLMDNNNNGGDSKC